MASYLNKTIGLDRPPIIHVSHKKPIIRYSSHRHDSWFVVPGDSQCDLFSSVSPKGESPYSPKEAGKVGSTHRNASNDTSNR